MSDVSGLEQGGYELSTSYVFSCRCPWLLTRTSEEKRMSQTQQRSIWILIDAISVLFTQAYMASRARALALGIPHQ